VERDMKKKLRLGKDVSVSICGTILESGDSGGKIVRSLRLPKKKNPKTITSEGCGSNQDSFKCLQIRAGHFEGFISSCSLIGSLIR